MRDETDSTWDVGDDFNAAFNPKPTQLTNAPEKVAYRQAISPRINLGLSEEENALLRAEAAGKTLSAYVRDRLFGANHEDSGRRQQRACAPTQDRVELALLLALLGESRIASNLNQLAVTAAVLVFSPFSVALSRFCSVIFVSMHCHSRITPF